MANNPSVLILDDGELDDVQKILEDLQVDFGRVRGGAIAPNTPHPRALLMATPRRISAVSKIGDVPAGEDPPVRVVVVDQDSKTLRDQLRQVGFDYLVRRPVHPEALRLLVMHSLYRGEEKRGEPRVAVGLEISFQTGEIPRRATLIDLSTGGCRLISSFEFETGKRILVTLSESVGTTEPITIEGKILRSSYDKRIGAQGMYSASVKFENLSNELRHELEWVIEDKVGGPPALTPAAGTSGTNKAAPKANPTYTVKRPGESRQKRKTLLEKDSEVVRRDPRSEGAAPRATRPSSAAASAESVKGPLSISVDVKMARSESPAREVVKTEATRAASSAAQSEPDAQATSDDRRTSSRHPYAAKVPAFGTRALRVLVGRDLSVGGMRVESNPDLEVGDRLHLAIYGAASEEPFLVWGTIARSDGRGGTAVVFDPVHATIAKQLEALVASLPGFESLRDDEASAMGTVLTEIINA